MEDLSEVSPECGKEDITCPGPLFRVKVMVLGALQSGKSSLIQCLLHNTHHAQTTYLPTEGINVALWTPFQTQGLERLLNRKLAAEEHHLTLELWDTSGRQVCQPVHALFLTTRTICVIVYDVSDDKTTEKVLTIYRMIQQKYAGSVVVLVGNKMDLLGTSVTPTRQKQLLVSLQQDCDGHKQRLATEIDETKALLSDCHPKDEDNDTWTINQLPEKDGQLPQQLLDRADGKLIKQHLAQLEQRSEAPAFSNCKFSTVMVSAFSGKGLDDFRKTLLEIALDPANFPYCSSSFVRPSTVMLYDRILALREHEVVLLPWQQLQELTTENSEAGEHTLHEDIGYLAAVGALSEFELRRITFPTSNREESNQNHGVIYLDGRQTEEGRQATERYVCVHPAVFATAACYCLIDDDKKSFRFEAGRFWPKDSGYKHPDPQTLCKVLEAIPQLGLLRECLLPLLWQEYSLSEDQVLYMLQVLQGLGLLAHHSDQKKLCEGLALPNFPKLSVHRSYALPLLGLLPDNRPQLNWTAKPFIGDIQVTWSFHLHTHYGLVERLLAAVLFLSRQCSNYRHLWRTGILLRVGEATLCVEQRAEGEGRVDVACRVNGDELGRETEATRMLWGTVAPFLMHVRHFLLQWPGLHFKETVLALGHQFYLDEKVENEPEVWVPAALAFWHRHAKLAFQEGSTTHQLDIQLLFPYEPDSLTTSVEDWLKLVMLQTNDILSDVSISSPPLPKSTQKAVKRVSMRRSISQQRKKKSVEVKWQLQEENKSMAAMTRTSSPCKEKSTTTAREDFQTPVITLQSDEYTQVKPQGRVVSAEEEQAEVVRLASRFVAAILASAMAVYVAEEAEGDQDGRKLVSTAQIAAARVTAEAALAVHTGDIEGAATAVIEAVNAVKGNNPSSTKPDSKSPGGLIQSKLCTLL